MSRKDRQLERLQGLTEAVYLAQRAKLAALAAEEARLKDRMADLDAARADRDAVLRQGLDLAAQAGVDPLWQQWADGRRVTLNREMAKLRVLREDRRSDLAKAFGRNEVAERLVKAARQERMARIAKKSDQTS